MSLEGGGSREDRRGAGAARCPGGRRGQPASRAELRGRRGEVEPGGGAVRRISRTVVGTWLYVPR